MLLYKIRNTEYGIKNLEVLFKDDNEQESIEVDIQNLLKDISSNLFAIINEYIHNLPISIQKEVFLEYKDYYCDEDKISRVVKLLNYENFKSFVRSKENSINIPDIEKEFTYDPNLNVIREKTYVYDEYIDLIALVLFFRMLIPAYADYFNSIKQLTQFYYFKLFSMFAKSELFYSPEIEKLREYIEINQESLIDSDKNDYLVIDTGLSIDDIVDNLISEVIFGKLLSIDFFTKRCNIISFIFQTIKYKGSFESNLLSIRSKSTNDPNKEDISYFEDYRKNSEVSIGTIVEIQHALSDINYILNNFKNVNFDYSLYRKEMDQCSRYINIKIDKIQIYILGWLINGAINPRALFYLDYKAIIDLLIFAKVLLYSNGHYVLSLLLSAQRANEDNILNIVAKNNLNKSVTDKIRSIYSYATDDKVNVIEKTITEISNNILNTLWIAINPLEEHMKFINKNNYIIFPGNLNQHFISLLEFINR